MSDFPGTLVSRTNFCGIFSKAWLESVTSANIKSGFRACGIFPYCPDAIPLEAYQPNLLYGSRTAIVNDNISNTTADSDNISNTTVHNDNIHVGLSNATAHDESSDGKQSNVADKSVACVNIGNANKDINISPNDTIGIAKDDGSSSTSNNIPQLNAVVNISDYLSEDAAVLSTTCSAVPPHIALAIHENNFSALQLDCFNYCYGKGYDLEKDEEFMTWKKLKDLSKTVHQSKDVSATTHELDISFSNIQDISFTSGFDLDLFLMEGPSVNDQQLAPLVTKEVTVGLESFW